MAWETILNLGGINEASARDLQVDLQLDTIITFPTFQLQQKESNQALEGRNTILLRGHSHTV